MTADVEDEYVVAQANEPLDETKHFKRARVSARRRDDILEIDAEKVDYMDVSPRMMVSVATACIPFLENDDCNRALMGSNMQRQAVPLMVHPAAHRCYRYGSTRLLPTPAPLFWQRTTVSLRRWTLTMSRCATLRAPWTTILWSSLPRSNAGTCINQRPIVEVGENVKAGQVLADGPACATARSLWARTPSSAS